MGRFWCLIICFAVHSFLIFYQVHRQATLVQQKLLLDKTERMRAHVQVRYDQLHARFCAATNQHMIKEIAQERFGLRSVCLNQLKKITPDG